MKIKIGFVILMLVLSSCNAMPMATITGTATHVSTITSTPTLPATKTATFTPSPIPMPTITPFPPSVLDDIFKQPSDNVKVNQYGKNTQEFTAETTTELSCVHSGQYGMRITTTKPNLLGGYWGIDFLERPFDVSQSASLVFWVKGQFGGENISIWMGANYGAELIIETKSYAEINASDWRRVNIPLNDFGLALKRNPPYSIHNVVAFSFDLISDSGKHGICIDDISIIP